MLPLWLLPLLVHSSPVQKRQAAESDPWHALPFNADIQHVVYVVLGILCMAHMSREPFF